MIKNLSLKKYGRFRDKTFEFAPVTLFIGLNESGKTTLFDALLDKICSPKGSTLYGKILDGRYTKEREAEIEFDGEPFSIDAADFINLFAVRSGEITLNIEQDSQWMNGVKASLFSGGIDPGAVSGELENILKSRARNSLNGEIKLTEEELKELEENKARAESLRQKCLDEEKRITGAESGMAQDKEEIGRLEKTREELEHLLEQQSLLQQQRNIKELLANALERRRYKEEQDKYTRFSSAVLKDLKSREERLLNLKSEVKKAAALEEETLKRISGSADEKAKYEKEKSRVDTLRLLAENLRDTLVPREKLVKTRTKRVWRKPLLALAGLFVIAGAVIFLIMPDLWVISAAAAGIACLCAVLAPAMRSWEDNSLLEEAVKTARERWKNETGEDAGTRYEDILASLGRAAERFRTVMEKYEQTITESAEIEKEKALRALDRQKAANAEEEAGKQLQKILDEAGITNIPDYAAMLEKKENIIGRCRELDEKLRAALAENSAATLTELEEIMNRRMAEISEKITSAEITPQELNAKQNLLKTTKTRLAELNRKEKENIGNFNMDLGTVRGQLKGLPEEIAGYEKNIMEKKERRKEIDKQLRAAKIAAEIFASMAEDSTSMLEQLSREITEQFSVLMENKRTVNMNKYSTDNADIADAQGDARGMDHLSAGTKDAFLLAARLVLARKSQNTEKSAVIVLDEPFLALDKQRTDRALSVLEEFRNAASWQIVLFTKDEEMEKQARRIFGSNLHVNRLSPCN